MKNPNPTHRTLVRENKGMLHLPRDIHRPWFTLFPVAVLLRLWMTCRYFRDLCIEKLKERRLREIGYEITSSPDPRRLLPTYYTCQPTNNRLEDATYYFGSNIDISREGEFYFVILGHVKLNTNGYQIYIRSGVVFEIAGTLESDCIRVTSLTNGTTFFSSKEITRHSAFMDKVESRIYNPMRYRDLENRSTVSIIYPTSGQMIVKKLYITVMEDMIDRDDCMMMRLTGGEFHARDLNTALVPLSTKPKQHSKEEKRAQKLQQKRR